MELGGREDTNRRMLRARDEMDRRYAETRHRYLQRRSASLGTVSRTFSTVVGSSPSEFRARHAPVHVPSCFITAWTRPRETVVSAKQDTSNAD